MSQSRRRCRPPPFCCRPIDAFLVDSVKHTGPSLVLDWAALPPAGAADAPWLLAGGLTADTVRGRWGWLVGGRGSGDGSCPLPGTRHMPRRRGPRARTDPPTCAHAHLYAGWRCPPAGALQQTHSPPFSHLPAAAIRTARPHGVDVSSHVAGPDGLAKDEAKVSAFVGNALQGFAQLLGGDDER